MAADPPHISHDGRRAEAAVSVAGDADTGVVELTIRGRWSRQLGIEVYAALRECLSEHPCAVIVDLRELNDLDAVSASMWVAASRAAARLRPPARLVLSMPPTRRLANHLRRLGAVRFLPIFTTVAQARLAVASHLPPVHRLHLNRLQPRPGSDRLAGDLVALACAAWGMPALLDRSRQVMAELVANATRHAGTDMALTVWRRGSGLYLAVRDDHGGSGRGVWTAGGAASAPARREAGLRTVDGLASACGVRPTRNGTVVWAIVHSAPQPPE